MVLEAIANTIRRYHPEIIEIINLRRHIITEMHRIYLDHNATTPIHPEVAEIMRPLLEDYFGNPSSTHWYGMRSKQLLEKARLDVAGLLDCHPDEIIFTSGGSESNNLALKGVAGAYQSKGHHIITSIIEHPAILEVCKHLNSKGFQITYLPVDQYGMVDPEQVKAAIRPDTILISIMHANNEVGTIQPVAEISKIARERKILMHTDAAQTVGKIPVRITDLQVDMLSLAGHKFGAPKGIGALYVKRGTAIEKLIHGANHEQNLRAGTENILEIAGMGKACELAASNLESNAAQMKRTRDLLHQLLDKDPGGIHLHGHPDQRLPNTLNISIVGMDAQLLLSRMNHIAASAGAACHADQTEVSHVLEGMNVPEQLAVGAIRFSTGWNSSTREMELAANQIAAICREIRSSADAPLRNGPEAIKLTEFTRGMGCACKIPPQILETLLPKMPSHKGKQVLVDHTHKDDAAVYQISEDTVLIQTLDFLTPMVDDPYDFGAIAAANALSDIYAMGGRPVFALNIVGFPYHRLPLKILESIMQGASDKAREAGMDILGGHSIEDQEPKFGLAVTGVAPATRFYRNSGAQPGDALILTKPIGTGILSTGIKKGLGTDHQIKAGVAMMASLNARPIEVAASHTIHACTDITGFGLLGHLSEMCRASGVDVQLNMNDIPLLEGTRELAALDAIPGGSRANLEYVHPYLKTTADISPLDALILADAQTSGGLLFALPNKEAPNFLSGLHQNGISGATIIGSVKKRGRGIIEIA